MHQIIQLSNVAVHADGSCPDGEFVLDLNIMSFLLSLLTQLLALSLPPSLHFLGFPMRCFYFCLSVLWFLLDASLLEALSSF